MQDGQTKRQASRQASRKTGRQLGGQAMRQTANWTCGLRDMRISRKTGQDENTKTGRTPGRKTSK
jgi:hypothetical protein